MAATMNREGWLHALAAEFEPVLASVEMPLSRPYRLTCGFPSSKARSATSRTIGECWTTGSSAAGVNEVFIHPSLVDPMVVAATVAHELIHAADNCEHGHRGPFVRAARSIGLAGKPTATVAGDGFVEIATPILDAIGPYPHDALNADRAERPKQSTRMLKVACPDCEGEGEPYIVRMSRTTIERGTPICPIHGTEMREAV